MRSWLHRFIAAWVLTIAIAVLSDWLMSSPQMTTWVLGGLFVGAIPYVLLMGRWVIFGSPDQTPRRDY